MVQRFQENLLDSYEAQVFLMERGLGEDEANGFRLGVVDDGYPGMEKYAGFLSIPYLREDGTPLTMRFRCAIAECEHERHGKYMSLPHDPVRLFNASTVISAGNTIAICEGELDTIVMQAIVGVPAVGLPGANSWSRHYYSVLEGFERIYVFGDPDEAGLKMNAEVTKYLPSARVVTLPLDIGDTLTHPDMGADFIRAEIKRVG